MGNPLGESAMLKSIFLFCGLALFIPVASYAQQAPILANTAASCNAQTYTAGQAKPVVQTTGGVLCVGGTFTPSGTGNVNIIQVGGNAVTTTVPVSGTVTTTPSGTQNVTGTGAAGVPATGVVTVQGIASGTVIPTSGSITGNVTVVQPTAANLNATVVGTGTFAVQTPLPSTIVTGQAKVAVTGTAIQLGTNALVNGLVIKAKSTNNATCGTIGSASVTNTVDGTGNGYITCPGEAASFATNNSNVIYVNGTAGDIFTFEGN